MIGVWDKDGIMMNNWKDKFPKENRYFETDNGILYCGDCLKIMKEFPKESVDLILTDPPYGINLKAQRKTSKFKDVKIKNDENVNIIKKFIPLVSKITNTIYMFVSWYEIGKIQPIFEKYFIYKNCLVWDKMWFGMGNNWRPNHEFIMYGVKNHSGKLSSNNKENILRHRRLHPSKMNHICEKPTSLLTEIIEQHNGIVLDCFVGSGSTLVACNNLNRRWVGIELEEKYCEISKRKILKEENLL